MKSGSTIGTSATNIWISASCCTSCGFSASTTFCCEVSNFSACASQWSRKMLHGGRLKLKTLNKPWCVLECGQPSYIYRIDCGYELYFFCVFVLSSMGNCCSTRRVRWSRWGSWIGFSALASLLADGAWSFSMAVRYATRRMRWEREGDRAKVKDHDICFLNIYKSFAISERVMQSVHRFSSVEKNIESFCRPHQLQCPSWHSSWPLLLWVSAKLGPTPGDPTSWPKWSVRNPEMSFSPKEIFAYLHITCLHDTAMHKKGMGMGIHGKHNHDSY